MIVTNGDVAWCANNDTRALVAELLSNECWNDKIGEDAEDLRKEGCKGTVLVKTLASVIEEDVRSMYWSSYEACPVTRGFFCSLDGIDYDFVSVADWYLNGVTHAKRGRTASRRDSGPVRHMNSDTVIAEGIIEDMGRLEVLYGLMSDIASHRTWERDRLCNGISVLIDSILRAEYDRIYRDSGYLVCSFLDHPDMVGYDSVRVASMVIDSVIGSPVASKCRKSAAYGSSTVRWSI